MQSVALDMPLTEGNTLDLSDAVPFREWCEERGISEGTGRRWNKAGVGPDVIRGKYDALYVTRSAAEAWDKRLAEDRKAAGKRLRHPAGATGRVDVPFTLLVEADFKRRIDDQVTQFRADLDRMSESGHVLFDAMLKDQLEGILRKLLTSRAEWEGFSQEEWDRLRREAVAESLSAAMRRKVYT